MILADKILKHRKENGWSQEDLAEKLNVSRQSISKWEGAQSTPDLERIIKMSEIFGVSTDYLLKDELEDPGFDETFVDEVENGRRVSLEEVNAFLGVREEAAGPIAKGVSLIIMSPVLLLILMALREGGYDIAENVAGGLGVGILLILLALAVFAFVRHGQALDEYSYMEKEKLDPEYGVIGMVSDKKAKYQADHFKNMSLGIAICVMSAVPLFIALIIGGEENEFLLMLGVVGILSFVALGVNLIVKTSIIWEGYNMVLEQGGYTKQGKEKNELIESIAGIYWLTITAAYLGYSFLTYKWYISWIIWPIAGILFGVISIIVEMIQKSKNK